MIAYGIHCKNLIILDMGRKRQLYKSQGAQYLLEGKRDKAMEAFQKCVDITPEIAYELIKVHYCVALMTRPCR
jgi:hypothetical protein